MKVVHVITGLDTGGAEAVLFRLATAGHTPGVEHHVISLMDRGTYADRLEQAGVAVSTLGMPRGKVSVQGLIALQRLMRQLRPDVVQTWMYHADLLGGIAARLAGIKAIVWGIRQANVDPAQNRRSTLMVMRLCARLSGWLPAKIVSCSVKAAELHQAQGYRPAKFITIPNGYALEHLKPDAAARAAVRAELGIPGDAFVLGMVARYDSQKDHQNLLDALARTRLPGAGFVCLLVGSGMDAANDRLARQIADAGVASAVRLLGQRHDIAAVMNALDVHVLSSLSEAFPNVLAEAMACGTPCVTTDAGDAALIVGEHGWVVPVRDPPALAEGIRRAHDLFDNDRKAWTAKQEACRSRIMSRFGVAQMCERYMHAWQLAARGQ